MIICDELASKDYNNVVDDGDAVVDADADDNDDVNNNDDDNNDNALSLLFNIFFFFVSSLILLLNYHIIVTVVGHVCTFVTYSIAVSNSNKANVDCMTVTSMVMRNCQHLPLTLTTTTTVMKIIMTICLLETIIIVMKFIMPIMLMMLPMIMPFS